jgi:hypothetical protein
MGVLQWARCHAQFAWMIPSGCGFLKIRLLPGKPGYASISSLYYTHTTVALARGTVASRTTHASNHLTY